MRTDLRSIATRLFVTAALCAAPLALLADEPAATTAKTPHMTSQEAKAYLAARGLAVVPDNLVGPIMSGDVQTVEALLSAGVDPNDTTDMPKPALRLAMSACAGGTVKTDTMLVMMEVLLAHGAKPNEVVPAELSPLMVAAQHCSASVVHRLVRAGADMKFKTSLGLTPLTMAFIVDNFDAAEALIDEGARLSPEAAAKVLDGNKDNARVVALVKRASGK
jgi:uncharacterized protein